MSASLYDIKQTEEYVSYVLEEDIFSKLEYKVLMNQEKGEFLPLHLLKKNGKIQFLYSIPPLYYSLALKGADMEPGVLFHVIDALDRICSGTENNGFLKLEHLDLNLNRIFIESNSGKLQMIYLPITVSNGTMLLNKDSVMRELVKELLSHNINLKVSGRIQKLNRDLQDGVKSFSQIADNIRTGVYDGNAGGMYFDGSAVQTTSDEPIKKTPYLIVTENQMRMQIDKAMFVIGKNRDLVDGVIYNHSEVSRKHCAVQVEAGKCYLKDLESTNGTYINRQRIRSEERVELHNEDRLLLGECELVFYEG